MASKHNGKCLKPNKSILWKEHKIKFYSGIVHYIKNVDIE